MDFGDFFMVFFLNKAQRRDGKGEIGQGTCGLTATRLGLNIYCFVFVLRFLAPLCTRFWCLRAWWGPPIDYQANIFTHFQVSGSISVSTPACHAGERGSTPRQRDCFFVFRALRPTRTPPFVVQSTGVCFLCRSRPPPELCLNQPHAQTNIVIEPPTSAEAGTFRTTTLSTISVCSSTELCCPLLQSYSALLADRSG